MRDSTAQSFRITRLAAQWFDLAFEAHVAGRKQDEIVARLAHKMCVAAHRNLVNNTTSGER